MTEFNHYDPKIHRISEILKNKLGVVVVNSELMRKKIYIIVSPELIFRKYEKHYLVSAHSSGIYREYFYKTTLSEVIAVAKSEIVKDIMYNIHLLQDE